MGGDIVSRSLRTALMRALALEREGLTAYLYTGGFGSPLPTLTESLHSDLALIDRVLGVKMAIAETWCGHLTDNEFARLIGDAYLGARLAGKAGVIHIHIGEGPDGLPWLQRQIPRIGIPWRHIVATHINRTSKMLAEAAEFALLGGHVDITALQSPAHGREHAGPPAEAVVRLLAAKVPLGHISMTSDAGASRVTVDANGQEKHVARTSECLMDELRSLVLAHRMPLETALVPFTVNPAEQLGLKTKGRIGAGMSADVVVLDPDLKLRHLFARGKAFIRDRVHIRTGHFEPLSWPQPLTNAS
jgi:beta-aspartyl-dipeptidase (metallo-type)